MVVEVHGYEYHYHDQKNAIKVDVDQQEFEQASICFSAMEGAAVVSAKDGGTVGRV